MATDSALALQAHGSAALTPHAYSLHTRMAVMTAVDQFAKADELGISHGTVYNWRRLFRDTRCLAVRYGGGPAHGLSAQGLAMVFNPTNQTVRTELPLPLYYTGLTDGVTVVLEDASTTSKRMRLERDYSLVVPLELAPRTATWLTFSGAA